MESSSSFFVLLLLLLLNVEHNISRTKMHLKFAHRKERKSSTISTAAQKKKGKSLRRGLSIDSFHIAVWNDSQWLSEKAFLALLSTQSRSIVLD